MKFLLSMILFLFTAFQSANAGGIPYTFNQKILQGKVIRVLDGDTRPLRTHYRSCVHNERHGCQPLYGSVWRCMGGQ